MASSNAAPISITPATAAPHILLLRGGARHRNAHRFRMAAAASSSSAPSAGGGAGGGSYLDMWRKAVDRERRSAELAYRLQASPAAEAEAPPRGEDVERRTARFEEMLRVPREERDRVQRRQVIDRAAAALAAARAVLKEPPAQSQSPESPSPAPPSPPPTPPRESESASSAAGSGVSSGPRRSDRASRPAVPSPAKSAEGTAPLTGCTLQMSFALNDR
ncbi:hypothetical protein PR202_gb13055 [Eleusine coracana subsp. coracana]|uniref:Uncharacterized protein n=1 Tax=Eleusine coracana subsp. coracana TaxID=191504 RepID=A0AAV5EPG5_ELECO|nr:hypothetical protein PR202_gb13055 [Eleusine coracana subsp. coracana]